MIYFPPGVNYFNPRSRKGSDYIFIIFTNYHIISIHAPARGATLSPVLVRAKDIFQSTLPQGERREFLEVPEGGELFQSTLPQGERPRINHSNLCYMIISIHAPARGATRILHLRYLLFYLFQSTLPQGERRCPFGKFPFSSNDFNPRSRKGSDHFPFANSPLFHYFNPRSRKGSDTTPGAEAGPHRLFQSTLPQGERQRSHPLQFLMFQFQSTLPQGERPLVSWE